MESQIELFIIEKVKAKRIELGLSQLALSLRMEMNDSFVSHVESPKKRAKYNINHINILAKVLNCSPKDFLPEFPF
ncbi:XRE family transcriptional regulator [Dyadobacter psychrotolerans]|uniref:XRE family transcriptional regulator n=1 Tax=Dyadobacter psychrotolerans TaxID=2541721 RepID=A0A4V2Z406_9BACT|nr:XRE family transcriptional regulator [Dyadobacter psychrotolerans]